MLGCFLIPRWFARHPLARCNIHELILKIYLPWPIFTVAKCSEQSLVIKKLAVDNNSYLDIVKAKELRLQILTWPCFFIILSVTPRTFIAQTKITALLVCLSSIQDYLSFPPVSQSLPIWFLNMGFVLNKCMKSLSIHYGQVIAMTWLRMRLSNLANPHVWSGMEHHLSVTPYINPFSNGISNSPFFVLPFLPLNRP